MSDNINELASALSAFQAEVKDAERNRTSYNGKYAELDQIFTIIRPILSKHGLSFMQPLVSDNINEVCIQTWIMHKSGQYIITELKLPPAPAGRNTNSLQAVGISASYGKRYAIMSALGICQKDESTEADEFTEKPKALPQAKQQPKEEPKIMLINHDQAMELLELIKQAGNTEEKIKTHYYVQRLLDMTVPQFEHCKGIMLKTIDKNKDKK